MICFVPHEVLVECSINSYESPKPKDSLGLFSEMTNWTKTMNETNHILKRIFSYSPPLQVCGKTKNEIKTTSRNFCAQAGFVIHHPCPIMVHSYRQVVWMVMSVFQSKLWRNQSMCIRCSWNHEDDKKAKGLIVTTLTPNKQFTPMRELEEPHGNECSMGVTDVLSVKKVVGVVMGC